jgi:hypothetical protein
MGCEQWSPLATASLYNRFVIWLSISLHSLLDAVRDYLWISDMMMFSSALSGGR